MTSLVYCSLTLRELQERIAKSFKFPAAIVDHLLSFIWCISLPAIRRIMISHRRKLALNVHVSLESDSVVRFEVHINLRKLITLPWGKWVKRLNITMASTTLPSVKWVLYVWLEIWDVVEWSDTTLSDQWLLMERVRKGNDESCNWKGCPLDSSRMR